MQCAPEDRYSNSLMVNLNARKSSAGPKGSQHSSGDTFGMRVHVQRQTQRTVNYERDVDQWPGVKLSQLGTADIAQVLSRLPFPNFSHVSMIPSFVRIDRP